MVWYSTVQSVTAQYSVVLYGTVWYRTVQCGRVATLQCGTELYSVVLHCTVLQCGSELYSVVLHCTVLHCGSELLSLLQHITVQCRGEQ